MSDDRQSKSAPAPPKCGTCGATLVSPHLVQCSRCWVEPPAPAPGAPPEWAKDAGVEIASEEGWGPTDALDLARLIHAAYLASEEARKVERADFQITHPVVLRAIEENSRIKVLEKALRAVREHSRAVKVLEIVAAALASPLVEET